jgi:Ca-activated chloride channel family protein
MYRNIASMPFLSRVAGPLCAASLLLGSAFASAHARPRPDDEDEPKPAAAMRMKMDFAAEALGATPGGAQDIGYFRDRVNAGEIPHPNTFTPEGLFSEHDLPIASNRPCKRLFCVVGEATDARLLVQPEIRYLGQLGFTTKRTANTFKRAPLNLVAVVDKSGPMSGRPLELVRASLLETLDHLGPGDRLSIVLYGDRSHVHLRPTDVAGNEKQIAWMINQIQSAGSTAMEEGLKVGFDLARRSGRRFSGNTRVMLFTDERPNVGRTDAKSFMSMAQAASRKGIGMTTIGVGVQFGAELATKVSSVRGGNLFFFPDAAKMRNVFEDEFDTLVTELAYDLELRVAPARGMKIAGIYGIPGDQLRWTKAGALELEIATVFLSSKQGAIYVAVAPDGNPALPSARVPMGDAIAAIDLRYTTKSGKKERSRVELRRVAAKQASVGLRRGMLLVDQITALKAATKLHYEKNDQEGAFQIVNSLAATYRNVADPALAGERELVARLHTTLAKLSGHAGEAPVGLAAQDPVTGLPR